MTKSSYLAAVCRLKSVATSLAASGWAVHRGHIWTMPALKPDLMLSGRLPKFPRSSDRQLGKGQPAWLYLAPQWM